MTPAQEHMALQLLFSVGMPPVRIVGDPGTQGATVMGMQGIGVNAPNAAAVAAATIGLAMLEHIPNVGMFPIGK